MNKCVSTIVNRSKSAFHLHLIVIVIYDNFYLNQNYFDFLLIIVDKIYSELWIKVNPQFISHVIDDDLLETNLLWFFVYTSGYIFLQ